MKGDSKTIVEPGEIKTSYRHDVTTVSHRLGKFEAVNAVELDIVRKGEIPGLWPPEIHEGMMHTELRFSISGFYSLESYLQSGISFSVFFSVVWKILKTLQNCESCGIRSSNLDMDAARIFYHMETDELRMLFWPLISVDSYTDMKDAFRSYGLQYACLPDDQYFRQEYLAYFESRRKFNVFDFEKALLKLRNLRHSGQTKPVKEYVVLRDTRAGRRIVADHFPFTIGRDAQKCDYAFTDDVAISRRHLSLHWSGGRAYAVDERSANGTVINGKTVAGGSKIALHRGTQIQIGSQILTVEEIRG